MARLFSVLTIFGLLWLPLLQNATLVFPRFTIDENRNLARWPQVSPIETPVAFFSAAQAWFDDRYGMRDFLIRLKTQIDYSVFATSSKVYIGHDGWLFYRSVMDVQKPTMEYFVKAEQPAMLAGLEKLTQALQARNVQLMLMPVMLGDVYYKKELPENVPHLPQPSAFYLATLQWRNIPGIMYIDTDPIIRNVMKYREAFHKTDFHWNDTTSFDVAKYIVNRLAAARGDKSPLWDHVLAIKRQFYIGFESLALPLFVQPSEQGYFLQQTWRDTVTLDDTRPGFGFVSTQTAPTARTLPSLCVVGDSFSDGLYLSGMPSYFRHVYFSRWAGPQTLGFMLSHLPKDCRYLLVEFIEVQSPAWPALENGARYLTEAPGP